jgi:hypothetical protein
VGLEDVSRYPYLLAELARTQGWTMNQLEKLAGRNFLRVFRKAEKVKYWKALGSEKSARSIPLLYSPLDCNQWFNHEYIFL